MLRARERAGGIRYLSAPCSLSSSCHRFSSPLPFGAATHQVGEHRRGLRVVPERRSHHRDRRLVVAVVCMATPRQLAAAVAFSIGTAAVGSVLNMDGSCRPTSRRAELELHSVVP